MGCLGRLGVMTLDVQRDGMVAILTLNDPKKRNALTAEKARSIEEAIIELEATRHGVPLADTENADAISEPVRAIVLRGEGPAFCAGADLSGGVYARDFFDSLTRMLTAVTRCPIPIIADVQGPAVGAGCQLVLASDLRIFGEGGCVWVPAAQHGFALDTWTHQRLRELVGGAHARNIMLGGQKLEAREAVATGLAAQLTDAEGALAYARRVALHAPLSMEHSKRVLNSANPYGDPALDMLFYKAWSSQDAQEAREAREQGRDPRFIGR